MFPKFKLGFILLFYLYFMEPLSLRAQDITIMTHVFPLQTEMLAENENENENQISGICEIITKALDANKMTYKVLWLPWKRAQIETLENKDKKTFIIPLTRNINREKYYNWVAKIYDLNTSFITAKGNKKINSMREAKGKRIGVLLGTSYENTLHDEKNHLDINDIEPATSEATNAKKLFAGRIDAWYSGIVSAIYTVKSEKMDIKNFEFGDKIIKEVHYIATPKSTPKDLVNKVKSAILNFQKTPQYSAIMKKYNF